MHTHHSPTDEEPPAFAAMLDERGEEVTIFPTDADDHDLQRQWVTARLEDCVDLEAMR